MSESSQFLSPTEHYDRFMGRYTPSLAAALADAAGIVEGQRVLDVGCGPGGLTAELAARTSAERVRRHRSGSAVRRGVRRAEPGCRCT